METIIKIENLMKSIQFNKKKQHILKGIDFEVKQGEMVAIMGPSGSGKSTLLGILGTIDNFDQGKLQIFDKDIKKMNESQLAGFRNQNIGIVFQSYQLLQNLTAKENVAAPMYVNKNSKDASKRAEEILNRVGLEDKVNSLPKQLSGGQQQRVAIARALANNPSLLLADEPTGNLDSTSGKQIIELIKKLQNELNITAVIVTHDPNIASQADRIVYMIDGMLYDKI